MQRWVLAGTDYVYPRTTNKILEAYLKSKGVKQEDIMINYTPFGHSDWQTIVADIKKFGSAGKKTAVVSTINGDANVPFYKELGNQGVKAKDIPVVAFSVGEEELAGIDTKPLLGHLAAWNYFQSIKTPGERGVHRQVEGLHQEPEARHQRSDGSPRRSASPCGSRRSRRPKTTDPDKVIDALPGIEAPNLTGGISKMLPNHHITKPVFIGEVRGDGQFDVVWKTAGPRPRRRLVEGARRLQGPGRRLGRQEVRQLQHQDQQVRRLTLTPDSTLCYAEIGGGGMPPPPSQIRRDREQSEMRVCANASSRSCSLLGLLVAGVAQRACQPDTTKRRCAGFTTD